MMKTKPRIYVDENIGKQINAPQEPGLLTSTNEAEKWVNELRARIDVLSEKLFGPSPTSIGGKQEGQGGLTEQISRISSNLACLVGEINTILSRIEV